MVTPSVENKMMVGFVLKIHFWAFLDHLDRCATGATIALGAIFLPIWSISSVRSSVSSLTEPFMGPSHEYKVRIRDYHFTNHIVQAALLGSFSFLHRYLLGGKFPTFPFYDVIYVSIQYANCENILCALCKSHQFDFKT